MGVSIIRMIQWGHEQKLDLMKEGKGQTQRLDLPQRREQEDDEAPHRDEFVWILDNPVSIEVA
jgi:hypothetical protein